MSNNKLNVLLEWCQNKGIRVDPRLQLRLWDGQPSGWNLGQEQSDGIGVFNESNEIIEKSYTLVYIPKTAVLSIKSCFFADSIPHAQQGTPDAHLALALALYGELSIGAKSTWYGYLQSLPVSRVDISSLWEYDADNGDADSREALAWIKGTEIFDDLRGKENGFDDSVSLDDIRRYYKMTVDPLMSTHLMLRTTLENYLHAYSLVSSRAFLVDAYHGLAMVPIADAFNHTQENHVHLESNYDVCATCGSLKECSHDLEENIIDNPISSLAPTANVPDLNQRIIGGPPYHSYNELHAIGNDDAGDISDDTDSMYEMVSNRPIMPYEHVFNTYGENLTNAQLLLHYGFTLDGNEKDVIRWNKEDLLSTLSLISEYNSNISELSLPSSIASISDKERRTGLATFRKRVRDTQSSIDEEEWERVRPHRRFNSLFEYELHDILRSREEKPGELSVCGEDKELVPDQADASSGQSWRSAQQSRREQGWEALEASERHFQEFMSLYAMLQEMWNPTESSRSKSPKKSVDGDRANVKNRQAICEWDTSSLVYNPDEQDPDTETVGYLGRDKCDIPTPDRRRHQAASWQSGLSSAPSASRPLVSHAYDFPSSSTASRPDARSRTYPNPWRTGKLWLNDEAKITQDLWLFCVLAQLRRHAPLVTAATFYYKKDIPEDHEESVDAVILLIDSITILHAKLEQKVAGSIPEDRSDTDTLILEDIGSHRQGTERKEERTTSRNRLEENKDRNSFSSENDNQGSVRGEIHRPILPLDLTRTRARGILVAEASSAEEIRDAGPEPRNCEVSEFASEIDGDGNKKSNKWVTGIDEELELDAALRSFVDAMNGLENALRAHRIQTSKDSDRGVAELGSDEVAYRQSDDDDRGHRLMKRRRRTSRGIVGSEEFGSLDDLNQSQPRNQIALTFATVIDAPADSHRIPEQEQRISDDEAESSFPSPRSHCSGGDLDAVHRTRGLGFRWGEGAQSITGTEARSPASAAEENGGNNDGLDDGSEDVPATSAFPSRHSASVGGIAARDAIASLLSTLPKSPLQSIRALLKPHSSSSLGETRLVPDSERTTFARSQREAELAYSFFKGVSEIVCFLCRTKIRGQGMHPELSAEQLGDIIDTIPQDTKPRTYKAATYALSERSLLESCISAWSEFADSLRVILMPNKET